MQLLPQSHLCNIRKRQLQLQNSHLPRNNCAGVPNITSLLKLVWSQVLVMLSELATVINPAFGITPIWFSTTWQQSRAVVVMSYMLLAYQCILQHSFTSQTDYYANEFVLGYHIQDFISVRAMFKSHVVTCFQTKVLGQPWSVKHRQRLAPDQVSFVFIRFITRRMQCIVGRA